MSNRILSYRSLMADGDQETILLSTKKGEIGYRITKFEGMPNAPGGTAIQESVFKIYTKEQSSVDGSIDFSDNRLLGSLYVKMDASDEAPSTLHVIFDQIIFNQDIYITHKDVSTGESCNYYLELEMISLSEDQAMVATLKDIRNNS